MTMRYLRQVKELNQVEQWKLERHPLDVRDAVLDRYAREGPQAIKTVPGEVERLKWVGLYPQRQGGDAFMLRIKVPGGRLDAAQEAFDAYDPGELGIEPLKFEHAFWCRRCQSMATSRTCPHPPAARVQLSGTAVRDLLARGELPPPEFSRPEVARLLADGYRTRRG